MVKSLVLEPLRDAAVCFDSTVSTTINSASNEIHVPVVASDPDADWVAENAEISISDGVLRTAVYQAKKVAGLTQLSNEALADSDPAALDVLMSGLVESLARRFDQAYFGSKGGNANKPNGLADLLDADVTHVEYDFTDGLDAFAAALAEAGKIGAEIKSWVVGPDTALALRRLKESSNGSSIRGLLDPDPTVAGRDMIYGRPVIVANYAATELGTTIYGAVPARQFIGLRSDAEVAVSDLPKFSSDATMVRAKMRATPAFPSPLSVIRMTPAA
jgi:HK97 family phage major capsid protein